MEQLAPVNFLPITFDTDPPNSIRVVYPKIEYPQITQINADSGLGTIQTSGLKGIVPRLTRLDFLGKGALRK